jgi:hypothetical protein
LGIREGEIKIVCFHNPLPSPPSVTKNYGPHWGGEPRNSALDYSNATNKKGALPRINEHAPEGDPGTAVRALSVKRYPYE